jgi:uncharacterized protein (DUF952 family)
VPAGLLGDALKWEPSRGGQLFPISMGIFRSMPWRRSIRCRSGPTAGMSFPPHCKAALSD